MEESAGSSQNICLKLSPYSNISNTLYTSDDGDIIIISDSSSKSTSSNSKYASKSKSISNKYPVRSNEIYILDSSDSDSTNSKNEKRYLETWKKHKKFDFIKHLPERKGLVKKKNVLYTSDESSTNSSEYSKKYITHSDKTSNSYMSSTIKNNVRNISNVNIQSDSTVNKRNVLLDNASGNSSTSSKSFKNTVQSTKTLTPIKKTDNSLKKNFSRKDVKNIMKNIKSTKLIYESPKLQKQNNAEQDKETDEDNIHPAISPENYLRTNNIVIDETQVDSESDVISDSQVNVTNHYKSHVNKFLDTLNVEKEAGTTCHEYELSERKRKQISQWIMANSPDSQSNSSFSVVPSSNKDDVSSGNSSLERLEMNYETPNNRGRIRQQPVDEKEITDSDYNKTPHTVISRQTRIDEYVQQSKNNAPELCTSKKSHTSNSALSTSTKNLGTNTPQKVDIMDCLDILEKLYGKSWRDKADILFPQSEPRKQVVPTKNRAVQTERKKVNKKQERLYITDSDDDSNTSLKNPKLQTPSIKKSVRKKTKPRDSFINDVSSSESGLESLYYTALTNPRSSTTSTQSKPKIPPITQKVIAICDTDSEDENNKNTNNQIPGIRRRKLSFSNDESNDSGTSEFDPGDHVPPKSIVRKDTIRTPRQTFKLNAPSKSNNRKHEKFNSFLASLSESVPIDSAHPDAKKYRLNFKNNKDDLCSSLYKLYNEKVFDNELPKDLLIEWNIRMRGTAGYCYNKKSVKTLGGIVKSSRIVLATKILDTPDRLRDTLIHEMCHAAAWLINNVSDGHGPFWTGWANKAMKTFPELPPIRRCHDYKIKTKFTYKCVGCGYSIGRHSKSLDIERKRCGHCYGKFELLVNKTTKSGTIQVQTPKREPTAFALYIKENYNSVKKERNAKHGEIMKILGQQFSTIKIVKGQENLENNPDTPC
ncbi:Acidic repeat-containing protein [Habropoda laboriosa]|uniref:Acidic repeat-containing protein n=2 Tax=Habropoda laboriosa TaxID=597456 RepID=A0A0L7RER7_9HYME|nr:Acidic repeat-containing protein [Habropoda laboriosa]